MARKKRKVPAMNATSSADIAFMLLIFFLITTSMSTDKGLSRRLPPPAPKDQEKEETKINDRNIFPLLINSEGLIQCKGEEINIRQLKDRAKEFIDNPYNDEKLPEKTEKDVPYFGKVMVHDKGVISLSSHRMTDYQSYISVQNELAKAYNELRNELSMKKFGKSFAEIDEDQQKALIEIYPQKISEAEPKTYGVKK